MRNARSGFSESLEARVFPSWNRRGGCAVKKKTASEAAQTGWSVATKCFPMRFCNIFTTDHPGRAVQRALRGIFLMARPPLLSQKGNTLSPDALYVTAH
jgi:hypothetical protein